MSTIDDSLFQRLWTKAVGTPGYDKAEWKELERIVHAKLKSPFQPGVRVRVIAPDHPSKGVEFVIREEGPRGCFDGETDDGRMFRMWTADQLEVA